MMTSESEEAHNSHSSAPGEVQGAIRIGITFTGRNILEEKLNFQEVRDLLLPLNRAEAVSACSKWNIWNTWVMFHHGTWKPAEADQQRLLGELIPPNAQLRALLVFQDEKFVSPFSEVCILGLIGLLCRFSKDSGGESSETRHGQRRLFRVLLALKESIFPDNFSDMQMEEQFPYAVRVILANASIQNHWAFDMGRLHSFLTIPELGASLNNITVNEWFLKRFGIDGNNYECVANILLGSAFHLADYSKLQEQAPALFKRMSPLLDLSSTTPQDVVHGLDKSQPPQPEPTRLSDVASHANVLLVRPMIRLDKNLICTSTRNLFNKIQRGLPYLCLEARTNPEEEKALPRIEFGYIFEDYITWLMKQWATGDNVDVVTNYWIPHGDGFAERDIVITKGDVGYLFEVKATVPAMKIRQFGNLTDLVSLHHKAARQAYTAAEALVAGEAFENKELTRRLPALKKVVPCSITYEFLGVRWPYSDPFEAALQSSVRKPLFSEQNGILPFQILDVQQIELWDDLFKLPSEIDNLFGALERRALDPIKRFRDFPEDEQNSFRTDYIQNPGVVRRMVQEAEISADRRLKEISQIDSQFKPLDS